MCHASSLISLPNDNDTRAFRYPSLISTYGSNMHINLYVYECTCISTALSGSFREGPTFEHSIQHSQNSD